MIHIKRIFIAFCMAYTLGYGLIACSHRPAPVIPIEQTAPAKAATSTSAQSAEIAPLVIKGVALGGIVAATAGAIAIAGPAPLKPAATTAAIAGSILVVGSLTIQRSLPYIPWLIVAGLLIGVWFLLHRSGKSKAILSSVLTTLDRGHDMLSVPAIKAEAEKIRSHLRIKTTKP